jgi:negative regulator of sigma E activity
MNAERDNWKERIDAALHSAGSATPAAGLEGRILTRLAAERSAMEAHPVRMGFFARMPGYAAPVLGMAIASLVCAVIVVGSVDHSRTLHRTPAAPVLVLPGQGLGAASAVHPAGPATAPMMAGPASGGRFTRHMSHPRARIAPNAKKADGVAVPAPGTNPQN